MLAQRQTTVGLSYFGFIVAFSLLTPFGVDNPRTSVALCITLLAIACWRWWISRRIIARQAYACARERFLFRVGCVLSAAAWAGFTYFALLQYGSTWLGFIIVVALTGITNGASTSVCMDLRLSLTYLALMGFPLIVWAFTPGPGTLLIVTMTCLYMMFLAAVSRRQNHALLAGFWDNIRLETQAMELRRAKDLAETATTAKTQFLAAMSHEIRTPLSGVLGLVNLLAETDLDLKQRDLTRSIQHSGEMLLTIVNDILDYSKIGAGKLTLESVAFEIRHVVSDVIEPMIKIAARKNLKLEFHVSAEVPTWVKGDPTRIKQVLNNLLSNAIKFTPKGKVQVLVHKDGPQVRFAVRDTGIGIATDSQSCLFDEFSQADQSTTRQFGGTGLGLAICRKLVEAMGGRIAVESVPNKGSLFWFQLPLPEEKPRTNGPVSSTSQRTDQLRILVAEDNPVNQKVIMHMVHKLGHQGTLVSNGAEAVAEFQKQTFDLVLMDCQMPEMDGFEAARIIRASGGNAPIIAVTANAFAEDREKCLRAGMTDHVSKPVQAGTLETVINRSMGILKECGLPPAGGSSHSLESLLGQVRQQQQHSDSVGEVSSAVRLVQSTPVSVSGDLQKM